MEIQTTNVELRTLKASSESKLIMHKSKSFASTEIILGSEDSAENYEEIDLSQWDFKTNKFIE